MPDVAEFKPKVLKLKVNCNTFFQGLVIYYLRSCCIVCLLPLLLQNTGVEAVEDLAQVVTVAAVAKIARTTRTLRLRLESYLC